MKIGLLLYGIATPLAAALRALLPDATVIAVDAAAAIADLDARPGMMRDLLACDHIVTHDLPLEAGGLATTQLRTLARQCHLLPALHFAGFHPDIISLSLDGARLAGPTGLLHSRIAVLAYLSGHTPAEAELLFNPLVFGRLGYFKAFAAERAALLRRFHAYRINLAPVFDSWQAAGCFMHAPAAPGPLVLFDLARLICTMAGLAPDEAALAAQPPDLLAREPAHPLYPAIAARLGLKPEGNFTPPQPQDGPRLAYRPDVFLQGSYDAFRQMPRAALRAAPGVAAGLAALGLPDTAYAAARAAAALAPPDGEALLTWTGLLLQIDADSTMVVQRRLRPEAGDATDLLTPHALRLDGQPRHLALLGGVDVLQGIQPGTIALRRGTTHLSAEPGRLAVRFVRPRVTQWETFLPLPRGDLLALRTLMRGGWLTEAGERIPRATVRLNWGFVLVIGSIKVPLATARPRLVSAPGEPARIVLPGSACAPDIVLNADPDDPDADISLDQPPDTALPAAVGSTEAFRAELAATLPLPPVPESLHPPLTISNAQRTWTLARLDSSARPVLGRVEPRIALCRAPDKTVLLGRGLEGLIGDENGVWKGHTYLLAPRRLANGAAAALLRDRPATVIEGPVCVFYNANLHNYYHWLAEAMMSLHILAPFLPEGTRLLLPSSIEELRASPKTGFDSMAMLNFLGFGTLPTITLAEQAVLARDVIWLGTETAPDMPAVAVRSFRDRAATLVPPPAARDARIYIKRRGSRRVANDAMVENYLTALGFTSVYLENMAFAEQIALFASASFIVAMHGAALANLLFCQPGTRVLEISPDVEFRPYFWMIAEKLGLAYGVLACATTDGTFNGDVNVDMREFRALMRIMRTMATEDINPPDEHKARAGGPKLEQAGAMARGAPARDRPKPRLPRQ